MPIDRITLFCFAASYTVALALELLQLAWPRPVQRLVGIGFGCAGLLAQTLFLAVQRPSLASQSGSLLFLSWILAVFYLYGAIHHRRLAWAVFVLPVVLGLIGLASASSDGSANQPGLGFLKELRGERFWGGCRHLCRLRGQRHVFDPGQAPQGQGPAQPRPQAA
jgi:hypothetical protein